MRIMLGILVAAATISTAAAQNSGSGQKSAPAANTGETHLPSHQENRQQQPQGPTGPLNTTTGGAPAESPQGQTPPGMQSAPEGSSKRIVDEPQR